MEDSPPLTIDGKSYTFDQYGVTTALPPQRKYLTYMVQKGNSFWAIASRDKVGMFELARVNNKSIFSVLHPGDELIIPHKQVKIAQDNPQDKAKRGGEKSLPLFALQMGFGNLC